MNTKLFKDLGIKDPVIRASRRKSKIDNVPKQFTHTAHGNKDTEETTKTFEVGLFLGRGGHAEVYVMKDVDTGLSYAGKITPLKHLRTVRHVMRFNKEIKIHETLDHVNVVRFISVFEDQRFKIMIMELCTNQTIYDLIRTRTKLTEPETRYYISKIARSLEHLHSQRVIHRDMKLGNIFLDSDMNVKLGDFGLSTQLNEKGDLDEDENRLMVGTPNYVSPEMLYRDTHGCATDMWGLGCILYTLLVGRPPFQTSDAKSTYQRIKDNMYYYPDRCKISDDAKDLIGKLLQSDPNDRLTAAEIYQHPFMTDYTIPESLPTSILVMPPYQFNTEKSAKTEKETPEKETSK